MNNEVHLENIEVVEQLSLLEERVKKLEDIISGGGSSSLLEDRLLKLDNELKELEYRTTYKFSSIDHEFDKLVRIVAELREIIKEQDHNRVAVRCRA